MFYNLPCLGRPIWEKCKLREFQKNKIHYYKSAILKGLFKIWDFSDNVAQSFLNIKKSKKNHFLLTDTEQLNSHDLKIPQFTRFARYDCIANLSCIIFQTVDFLATRRQVTNHPLRHFLARNFVLKKITSAESVTLHSAIALTWVCNSLMKIDIFNNRPFKK